MDFVIPAIFNDCTCTVLFLEFLLKITYNVSWIVYRVQGTVFVEGFLSGITEDICCEAATLHKLVSLPLSISIVLTSILFERHM